MPQLYSDNNAAYSVDMMFAYLKDFGHWAIELDVQLLTPILKDKCWYNSEKRICHSPTDVLASPESYQNDYRRIIEADMSYPIIVTNKYEVVDGVHRLTKAHLEGVSTIKAYVFDEELMERFKLADKGEGMWDTINKFPLFKLLSLYHQRFCTMQ